MTTPTGETAGAGMEPLWTDERIHSGLEIATDAMLDYAESFNVGLEIALKACRHMRDEYEAKLTTATAQHEQLQQRVQELERELAQMQSHLAATPVEFEDEDV